MAFTRKQFCLSPFYPIHNQKLENYFVTLPPETFSSTAASPSSGISFDSQKGIKIIKFEEKLSSTRGIKSKQVCSSIKRLKQCFKQTPDKNPISCKTEINKTKKIIEKEYISDNNSCYDLSDVSSLDLNCEEEEDYDSKDESEN